MKIRNRLAQMALATILSVSMVPSIGVFAYDEGEVETETEESKDTAQYEVIRSEEGSIGLALPVQQKYSESGNIPAGLNRTFNYVLIADDASFPMPEGSELYAGEESEESFESDESYAYDESGAYYGSEEYYESDAYYSSDEYYESDQYEETEVNVPDAENEERSPFEGLLVYPFSLTANETLELPEITYTHAGVYTYTVAPVLPEKLIDRMTYDTQVYNITVAVVNIDVYENDELVSKLGIQVIGDDGTEYKPSNIIFTNAYTGPSDHHDDDDDDDDRNIIDTIAEVLGVNRDQDTVIEDGEVLGESRNPQTSDAANALMWAAILALAGAGVVTVSVAKHKSSK